MGCFSLGMIENLLIWAVVIGAFFAVVKLLLPHVLGPLGVAGGLIVQILTIILWAVILIFIIVLAFDLLSCLVPLARSR